MKKIKEKMYKILSVCLATLMILFNVISSNTMVAKASSFAPALGSEATAEIMMILWNFLVTGQIVSGVDSTGDYEIEKMCFEGFMETLAYDFMGFPDRSILFVAEDGRHIDLFEFMEETGITISAEGQWVDGTGAVVIPSKETWEKYRVIDGGAGGEPEEPDDPEDPEPEDPFNYIQSVTVGNGFAGVVGGFFEDIWNNDNSDINPNELFFGLTDFGTQYYFDDYVTNDLGEYDIQGYIYAAPGATRLFYFDTVVSDRLVAVYDGYSFQLYYLSNLGSFARVPCKTNINGGALFDDYYENVGGIEKFSLNIPVFSSYEAMVNYKENGNLNALLNGVPYDFTDLVKSTSGILGSLSGLSLNPNALPDINNSLMDSVADLPEPGTDPAENTNNFKSIIAGVLNDLIPGALADSDIVPSPNPGEGTEPDIDTSNYFGILGQILNAIKAIAASVWEFFSEPITAIKNGVLRIIEIIPEQIELILGNIVTLPQAIFDLFSDPLVAIQEAFALLPSAIDNLWLKLEPYLQSFKLSLQQPWEVPDEVPPDGGDGVDDGTGKFGLDFLYLLNGLFLLILILIMLLSIFIHCLEFIINIFKIEATTGFLPEDMITGLNYIKELEIPGIGMSIYDFMMMLVYILIVFGVIRVLRKNINFIHVPKSRN